MTNDTELTLINVPGKNTRGLRRQNGKSKKRPPGGGRPMLPTKLLKSHTSRSSKPAAPIPDKQKKPRSLRHIKSRNNMSQLEKLPTELLERIYLYSLELNLPRASPIIMSKLSSEHIYRKTLILTYGPYWHKRFMSIEDSLFRLPYDKYGEPTPQEQSAVLRCRWATLGRFRNAEISWASQKRADTAASLLAGPWPNELPIYEPPDPLERLDNLLQLLPDSFERNYESFISGPPEVLFHVHQGFISGPRAHERNDEDRDYMLSILEGWQPLLGFRPTKNDTVDIPVSLLRAPWTDDKVKFLFYLWTSKAGIDTQNSTAGEEAVEGLKEAILSSNKHVVWLLTTGLKIFIPYTTSLIVEFLEIHYASSRSCSTDEEREILNRNLEIFRGYFKDNLVSKYHPNPSGISLEHDRFGDMLSRRPEKDILRHPEVRKFPEVRKRKAEVEREVLEMRRAVRTKVWDGVNRDGGESGKVEWMARFLEDVYGLR